MSELAVLAVLAVFAVLAVLAVLALLDVLAVLNVLARYQVHLLSGKSFLQASPVPSSYIQTLHVLSHLPPQPYFMSLKNSFSEPHAELRPRLQKWFYKHPSKKLVFSEFLNLSKEVLRRPLPPKIASRWHYRLPIKNLTVHYNSQFCVTLIFCFAQEA